MELKSRAGKWIGHTLRKPAMDGNTTKAALDWNPQGKKRRGSPGQTWRRSSLAEIQDIGVTWTAANRIRWKTLVSDLCSARK